MDAHTEGGLERLTEKRRHLVPDVIEVLLRHSSQARVAQDAAADELVQQPDERLALVCLQAGIREMCGEVYAVG